MDTRFFYDNARTAKHLQQSTDISNHLFSTPGIGANPAYISDRHIRLQQWGANMHDNTINLESDLRGMNNNTSTKNNIFEPLKHTTVTSKAIQYPTDTSTYTTYSKDTHPSKNYRNVEQHRWDTTIEQAQQKRIIPFQHNMNTRQEAKDNYSANPNVLPMI